MNSNLNLKIQRESGTVRSSTAERSLCISKPKINSEPFSLAVGEEKEAQKKRKQKKEEKEKEKKSLEPEEE